MFFPGSDMEFVMEEEIGSHDTHEIGGFLVTTSLPCAVIV